MNRIWWKRITAIVVFFISLFVIDFILNRDNSEITMDMPKATLPVVSVMAENHKMNTMYGYTSKREEAYTKDSITPISEKREITYNSLTNRIIESSSHKEVLRVFHTTLF